MASNWTRAKARVRAKKLGHRMSEARFEGDPTGGHWSCPACMKHEGAHAFAGKNLGLTVYLAGERHRIPVTTQSRWLNLELTGAASILNLGGAGKSIVVNCAPSTNSAMGQDWSNIGADLQSGIARNKA